MAIIYVDPLNGTDNGDAGRGETDGTSAYASISYALGNYGSFSTTAPNTIYLADTAADVLSSRIDADTSVAKAAAPLGIEGYHYDGSNGGTAGALTLNLPWGRTVSGGEIDGNDAVAHIFDAATSYVHIKNVKLHSTTSAVMRFSQGGILSCEIFNGTTWVVEMGTNSMIRDCKIYNDTSAGVTGIFTGGNVFDCEISGVDTGVHLYQAGCYVSRNLIYNVAVAGILIRTSYLTIFGNTIDGSGGGATSYGIRNSSDSVTYKHTRIAGNLIANFDGASAKAIYTPAGAGLALLGNNAFYSNTTDSDTDPPSLIFDDITETSDPFTNSASNDFSLVTGANSIGAAIFSNGDPANPNNIGAWQDYSSGGGGGGGGQTAHVFAG